jgi:DNA-binding HxlR family transcriptional regulator
MWLSGRISYEVTDFGPSAHRMVRGVKAWADTHRDDVLAHRASYDSATA